MVFLLLGQRLLALHLLALRLLGRRPWASASTTSWAKSPRIVAGSLVVSCYTHLVRTLSRVD